MKKFIFILLISSLYFSLCSFSKTKDLDNTTISWFFIPNDKSETPQVDDKLNFKLSDYNDIYSKFICANNLNFSPFLFLGISLSIGR